MGAIKNNLIVDMENTECDYDEGCVPDLADAIRLQKEVKSLFERQLDKMIGILRRFSCK